MLWRGNCFLAIFIAAVLVASAGMAALAEGTAADWHINFQASSQSYAFNRGGPLGSQTGATDGCDLNTYDLPFAAPTSQYAASFVWESDYTCGSKAFRQDMRAALAAPGQQKWNVIAYVGTAFSYDALRVSFYSDSGYEPPATVDGVPYEYIITVLRDPTGSHQPGSSNTYTPGASGTRTTPPLYMDFYNLSAVMTTSPTTAAMSVGISLEVAARPVGTVTHVISGFVRANGVGLQGVSLSWPGGAPAITRADGFYAIVVPDGWSGTVEPTKNAYGFAPWRRIYCSVHSDLGNQDFTAVPGYTISGTVYELNGTAPFAGATVNATDLNSVTTGADGKYRLIVPSGWTGYVTVSY